MAIGGIHHVTAIAGDAARNVDFYTRALGLRMVKRTVNFDDPGTWHLYYGDAAGDPGTIMTFFPFEGAAPGRQGAGQAVEVSFAVPEAALSFWIERLTRLGIAYEGPAKRLGGETVVSFRDPDGLHLELVADPDAGRRPGWASDGVGAAEAIRGFHGVTLWERDAARTADLLTGVMGYREAGAEGGRRRFEHAQGGIARFLDVRDASGFWSGSMGAGTVHHVAFRVPDDAAQAEAQGAVRELGIHVTPVLDRQYFRSIYFREPGGAIFEVATDPPGFAVDEPAELMGTQLRLPAWLEPRRAEIAAALPALGREEEAA